MKKEIKVDGIFKFWLIIFTWLLGVLMVSCTPEVIVPECNCEVVTYAIPTNTNFTPYPINRVEECNLNDGSRWFSIIDGVMVFNEVVCK